MKELDPEKVRVRAERLAQWWPLLNEPYEGLKSRREETSSMSGFDDEPGQRPCEHRLAWRRGKLCLGCDNTGWRNVTDKERDERVGVDPYSSQLSSGITIVKDESPASRRAREAERRDAVIAGLQRDARVRAGAESLEDRSMRNFRLVDRKPHTVRRILRAIEALRLRRPGDYEKLPRHGGLVALAEVMYETEHFARQLPPAPTSG